MVQPMSGSRWQRQGSIIQAEVATQTPVWNSSGAVGTQTVWMTDTGTGLTQTVGTQTEGREAGAQTIGVNGLDKMSASEA